MSEGDIPSRVSGAVGPMGAGAELLVVVAVAVAVAPPRRESANWERGGMRVRVAR
jgi:hypothetical protein